MKKSRYTEEQITFASRQAEAGTPVADVCRQMGIVEGTFYLWKKKYGNLGVTVVPLDDVAAESASAAP